MKELPFIPEAVIFDMDGVITDTMSLHFKAWKKAFKSIDIDVGYYDIYLREGQKGTETATELMKENNIKPSTEKVKKLLDLKESIFKEIAKPKLIKGSKKLVTDLKKSGFILALVTGTARSEVKYILPEDLYSLFDVTVTGDEVETGKPNPEPYNKALKHLKIGASRCIVLENAPFGIKSAKDAGLFCIAVTTYLPSEHLNEANMVLNSLEEVDKVLCRSVKYKKSCPRGSAE